MEPPQFTPPGDQPPQFQSNYPREGMGFLSQYPPGIYFEFIGKAWTMITKSLGSWLIYSLVSCVAALLMYAAAFMMTASITGTDLSAFSNPRATSALVDFQSKLPFVLLPLVFVVRGFVNAMMLTAIDIDQGRPFALRIAEGFKNFPMLFVTSAIISLPMLLDNKLFNLPSLLTGPFVVFAPFICSKEGLDPIKSIVKGFVMIKPFLFMFILLYIVSNMVTLLGLVACCIGFLVTMPIASIVMGLHYTVLNPTPTVGESPQN